MRNIVIVLLLLFSFQKSRSQGTVIWEYDFNGDSITQACLPVKLVRNGGQFIYALNRLADTSGIATSTYSISCMSLQGLEIWRYVHPLSPGVEEQANDMDVDDSGNVYVAGVRSGSGPGVFGFIRKYDSNGNPLWNQTGNFSFAAGACEEVHCVDSGLYVMASMGTFFFSYLGVELWAQGWNNVTMITDKDGNAIVSGFQSTTVTLRKYTQGGSNPYALSTINAECLESDSAGHVYLLAPNSFGVHYEIAQFDAAGNTSGSYNGLPYALPFGDIGIDLVVDPQNHLWAVGMNDTMMRFRPSGAVALVRSMQGMDTYITKAALHPAGGLVSAGTFSGFAGNDIMLSHTDTSGNQLWSATYSANVQGQEYLQDFICDASGIYFLEKNELQSRLVKMAIPGFFSGGTDYSLLCVDSVYYDSTGQLVVSVFNGGVQTNYPTVQVISPAGDTIGNPSGQVQFFAQLPNETQDFQISVTQSGITDFSGYTFLYLTHFGDSSGVIGFCPLVTAISGLPAVNSVHLYPNPAHDFVIIKGIDAGSEWYISDVQGRLLLHGRISDLEFEQIDIGSLRQGMYIFRGPGFSRRFIRQ